MPVDKFERMSDSKTRDTGVSLTYINNNYIRSDGGTPVSGSIDMRGNTLYNVSNPVNPQDVATKEYADKRTHIIAVHAKYCGPLKKGEYPFKCSGGNFETCEKDVERYGGFKGSTTGFLMPHSGRIKKVIGECLSFLDFNVVFEKMREGIDGEEFEKFKKKFEGLPTNFRTIDKQEKFFF